MTKCKKTKKLSLLCQNRVATTNIATRNKFTALPTVKILLRCRDMLFQVPSSVDTVILLLCICRLWVYTVYTECTVYDFSTTFILVYKNIHIFLGSMGFLLHNSLLELFYVHIYTIYTVCIMYMYSTLYLPFGHAFSLRHSYI